MDKSTLLKKLRSLHANKKASIPALKNVLIQASTYRTDFITTDLDVFTTATTHDNLLEDMGSTFTCHIPLDALIKAVNATPNNSEIHLSHAKNKLTLHTAIGKMHIPSESRDSFPSIPEISEHTRTDFTTEIVEKMVNLLPFAANDSEIRGSLIGIHFNSTRKELVATNGHYMGLYKNIPEIFPMNTIIQRTGIKPLEKLVKSSGDYDKNEYAPMAIGYIPSYATDTETGEKTIHSISSVQFSGEDWSITIKSQEGPYPPYEKVIPANNKTILSLDRKVIDNIPMKLLNAATHQIMFTAEAGKVNIYGENIDEMSWEAECGTSNDNLRIAFNANLLQEIANFVNDNPLKLYCEDSATAVIYEDEDRLALLMPVRLPD